MSDCKRKTFNLLALSGLYNGSHVQCEDMEGGERSKFEFTGKAQASKASREAAHMGGAVSPISGRRSASHAETRSAIPASSLRVRRLVIILG